MNCHPRSFRARALLSALALVSIALAAAGQWAAAAGSTANVSWTAPTAYTDGSTLPAADIAHYTISWAPAAGQAGPSGSLDVAGSATTATVPVACGQVSFTLTVTTTATAKWPNATSAPTGPVPYVTGIGCAPNPPGGLTVTPAATAAG